MRTAVSTVISTMLAICSAPAFAVGVAAKTTLAEFRAQSQPKVVIVKPNKAKAGSPPACSENARSDGHRMSFSADPTTPEGQAIIATALAAAASGQQVSIFGTGACPIVGDIEGIGFIVLEANER
jgi:hypothetical protein